MKNFLKGAVLSGLVLIITAAASFAASLTHGPVVGGVTPTEAKVFVRTNQTAFVTLQYGTQPDLSDALLTSPVQTSSSADFTTIISLTNLNPSTTYYLNVAVGGAPQFSLPYPSFATFPATLTPQPFSFIILTDFVNQQLTQIHPTFLQASREGASFVFIGGDFDHRNPTTLFSKRQMFKISIIAIRRSR
jgi:phosphodiesterase/alkaline phosphatase D-like protein